MSRHALSSAETTEETSGPRQPSPLLTPRAYLGPPIDPSELRALRNDLDVFASVLTVSGTPSPLQDLNLPVANPPDLALVCVAAVTELLAL